MLITVDYQRIPKDSAQRLYLLDTPVISSLAVPSRLLSRYQQLRGKPRRYVESRLQIREALLNGTFKNGVITHRVYNELQEIVNQPDFYDGEVFHHSVSLIKSNPYSCLHIITIPHGTSDKLADDVKERLDKSELHLFATALITRIPTIVTDHDRMFYPEVKARLGKIYDSSGENERRLEILDSNGLAYLIKTNRVSEPLNRVQIKIPVIAKQEQKPLDVSKQKLFSQL